VLCFRTIVQYNYCHDNDYAGIIVFGYTKNGQVLNTDDVVIRYNIVARCENGAFALVGDQLSNTHWYNNTSYASRSAEQVTGSRFGGTVANTHRFTNNIFYQGAFDLSTFGNATVQFNNNCYFNNEWGRPDDAAEIVADPKLVNPESGGDTLDSVDGYRLVSGSPCIDTGAMINDGGDADYWGKPVPVGIRDVGAHEFEPANDPPASPTNLRVIGLIDVH
jgi:hypothetical protein